MNTPKLTKRGQTLKRVAENAVNYTSPPGRYKDGIDDPKIAALFAACVSRWPDIEDDMVQVLCDLMDNSRYEIGLHVFNALVSQNTRMLIFRSLLNNTETNEDKPPEYDQILDEFGRLNAFRNELVHSYWATHDSGDVFRFQSRLGYTVVMSGGRLVESGELEVFMARCNALSTLIMKTLPNYRTPSISINSSENKATWSHEDETTDKS